MSLSPLRALVYRVGFALRESGQALERVGCRLQGIYSYEEQRKRDSDTIEYQKPRLSISVLEPHFLACVCVQ